MSLALLKTFLQLSLLQKSLRLALLIYCWHACELCHRVFISISTLAKEMNCSERNAKKTLAQLVTLEHLTPTGEFTSRKIPVYRISIPGVSIPTPDEIKRMSISTKNGNHGCRYCHPINNLLIDKKEKKEEAVSLSSLEDEKAKARFLLKVGVTPGSLAWTELMSSNGGDPN